jgi:integrase
MPRLNHRNPSYRKHSPSGQAVVTIAGRDIYLGPYGTKTSKAEYDRVVAEWLVTGRQSTGQAADSSDLTVAEVVDRFWTHVQVYYRHPDGTPTSEVDCFKHPLKLLNRLYGHTIARNFGPLALEAVRNAMIEANWCRRNINNQIGRVRQVFRWAVAKEFVPPFVHHGLVTLPALKMGRTTARESGPVKPVPDAIVNATVPFLSSIVAAMVQVQRLTGARPGEVCMMRTADIDKTEEVWIYRPVAHKTAHHGHSRDIFIGPKAKEILRQFLKPLNPQAFIFSPREADAERREKLRASRVTPLSCGNRPGTNRKHKPRRTPGERYDVTAYRHAITRACDLAFLPPEELLDENKQAELKTWRTQHRWHPHQLRHSAATDIRKHFGIEAAQTVLGHTTLTATQIYAEKNVDAAKKIASAIG